MQRGSDSTSTCSWVLTCKRRASSERFWFHFQDAHFKKWRPASTSSVRTWAFLLLSWTAHSSQRITYNSCQLKSPNATIRPDRARPTTRSKHSSLNSSSAWFKNLRLAQTRSWSRLDWAQTGRVSLSTYWNFNLKSNSLLVGHFLKWHRPTLCKSKEFLRHWSRNLRVLAW